MSRSLGAVNGGRERLGGDTHSRFELRLVDVCDDPGRQWLLLRSLPFSLPPSNLWHHLLLRYSSTVASSSSMSLRSLLFSGAPTSLGCYFVTGSTDNNQYRRQHGCRHQQRSRQHCIGVFGQRSVLLLSRSRWSSRPCQDSYYSRSSCKSWIVSPPHGLTRSQAGLIVAADRKLTTMSLLSSPTILLSLRCR
jgi:hypothetical protein